MKTLQRPARSTPAERLRGASLLNFPMLNRGTAFTDDERSDLGLHGLLPPQIESLTDRPRAPLRRVNTRTTTWSGTFTCGPCRIPTRCCSIGCCWITLKR